MLSTPGSQSRHLDDKASKEEDDPKQKTLSDAPTNSSIVYLAWLEFPPKFLEKMAVFEGLDTLAVSLGATKIGASKSIRHFRDKMSKMQMYFSFATLRYVPFAVPPDINFGAFDAEKAFHYLFNDQLLSGEWYNLSDGDKELKKID